MKDEIASRNRAWVETDPNAVLANLLVMRRVACETAGREMQVMAVVKADAYGHGLDRIAAVLDAEVDLFGVACVHEAMRVRATGAKSGILLLGSIPPDDVATVAANGWIPTISSLDEADNYQQAMVDLGGDSRLNVHLVVDTGMGREGAVAGEFFGLVDHVRESCTMLAVGGVMSHYPSADEDDAFTIQQTARFDGLMDEWARRGDLPAVIHLANSAGLIGQASHHATMVRGGLLLYGVSPLGSASAPDERFVPSLQVKARITLVRDLPAGHGVSYGRRFVTENATTTVATVAIGYGDGYFRHLSCKGAAVLIGGKRCPLLGNITMDQIMVDVSDLDERPRRGDVAVVLGRQGEEEISAAELAERAGTISWEILTRFGSPRLGRVEC